MQYKEICEYDGEECLDIYNSNIDIGIRLALWWVLQLIARAYPYIAKRLLTDEAEELRGALEEFLIQNGSFRSRKNSHLVNVFDDYLISGRTCIFVYSLPCGIKLIHFIITIFIFIITILCLDSQENAAWVTKF